MCCFIAKYTQIVDRKLLCCLYMYLNMCMYVYIFMV